MEEIRSFSGGKQSTKTNCFSVVAFAVVVDDVGVGVDVASNNKQSNMETRQDKNFVVVDDDDDVASNT